MRTAIYGCGSMGTVLGAYLNKNGQETILIDSYAEHVRAMNEKGARVIHCADFTVPVKAITPDRMEGKYELVFLLTKQTVNKEVLNQLLPFLNADSIVCTLQNGVPEPGVAGIIGKERTVGGTVLWGATFVEPGVSELTQDISQSDCLFEIGEIDGVVGERIQRVAGALEAMGPVRITDNLMGARWLKVMFNSCWSGMSAALGCTFGEIIDNPAASACMSYIANEAVAVCQALGYKMPDLLGIDMTLLGRIGSEEEFKTSQQIFYNILKDLRPAKASMLQDLEKGKLTEVGMINGYICDEGRKAGIPTPFNKTVVNIVRWIEAGEMAFSRDNLKYFPESGFGKGGH
ncbi:ketopantoate reductase family protein [Desulfosporosinus sp. PR]|uniref:ketopantoate reductase family protein n=1 Tax=Candidatus Desulfosporosinus nitrosoreducens TaxID=3401928 RepID=UPI0027EC43D7|nr:ketopantoate reductase family protein [Desulfosporosinus sp. PR]MDQ7093242.1 ketopantoate reductase family protein [Desulfosporosinus sp. PR]